MTITSPSHAIELLGGARLVSGRIDRPFTTVASWASRASIPVDVWAKLIDLAKEKALTEFTYEALARAHAEPIPVLASRAATKAEEKRAGLTRRARA